MTSIESFFAGGGGKSISWKDKPIGTVVSGTVITVHEPRQQTDPVDQSPVFKKDKVTPKMSIRIDLQTQERDPADPDDDGRRGLYVQGWMQGALGDALRKAGVKTPEPGGFLAVALTERTPNENPALQAINKFQAQYTPPAPQATMDFFSQGAQPAAAPQQAPAQQQFPQQVPVPNISGTGYVQQPAPPQQFPQPPAQPQFPQAPAQQAPAAVGSIVAKPDAIDQATWDRLDDATKAQVAATFANVPPF